MEFIFKEPKRSHDRPTERVCQPSDERVGCHTCPLSALTEALGESTDTRDLSCRTLRG